jgi:hypothetical protein
MLYIYVYVYKIKVKFFKLTIIMMQLLNNSAL